MSTRVAPSVLLEEQIAEVLSHGINDGERLSEINPSVRAKCILPVLRGTTYAGQAATP